MTGSRQSPSAVSAVSVSVAPSRAVKKLSSSFSFFEERSRVLFIIRFFSKTRIRYPAGRVSTPSERSNSKTCVFSNAVAMRGDALGIVGGALGIGDTPFTAAAKRVLGSFFGRNAETPKTKSSPSSAVCRWRPRDDRKPESMDLAAANFVTTPRSVPAVEESSSKNTNAMRNSAVAKVACEERDLGVSGMKRHDLG